ncbi:MAG TPA: glycogen synthase GlgA [Nitrospiria bacterium]|nr:glycogen synthase GlgA [Nitrospiria bacterium]
MRILYAASEVVPFAKTGGLADVAGALPAALARSGHEVKVVMPRYASVDEKRWELRSRGGFTVRLAGKDYPFMLWAAGLPENPVEVLFLSHEGLFGRAGLYQEKGKDYPDNLERFAAFGRAVLEVPKRLNWPPDVLHGNDWQTALLFVYRRVFYLSDPLYRKTGALFTIHNLGYQGLSPGGEFGRLGLPAKYFTPDTLEFYGQVNPMKAGLLFADVLNTVSPTYSREIQTPEFGCGLEGVLQGRRSDLFGIVNGVDDREWDPSHDAHLPQTYDVRNLKGKRICKEALQKECRLPVKDVPLIGMITRLASQKGMDLVLEVLEELMQINLQLVVLGSGEPEIQQALKQAMRRHPEKLSVHLAFDEPLAHRIEAGSDLFLMPSRYEPCGLNQMYSLRYGTVPLVRKTGGLADTVVDATPSNLSEGKADGFVFEAANSHALLTTVRLALKLFREKDLWYRMMRAGMAADFSWDRSAREYEKLYRLAVEKARLSDGQAAGPAKPDKPGPA